MKKIFSKILIITSVALALFVLIFSNQVRADVTVNAVITGQTSARIEVLGLMAAKRYQMTVTATAGTSDSAQHIKELSISNGTGDVKEEAIFDDLIEGGNYLAIIQDITPPDYTHAIIGNDSYPFKVRVDARCGLAFDRELSVAPAAPFLCDVAKSSSPVLTGEGPWTWTCVGIGGGQNISCKATLAPVKSVVVTPQQPAPDSSNPNYYPLAPITGVGSNCVKNAVGQDVCIKTNEPGAFGNYLNILIKVFMGICAVLAMIMIVLGGVQYMTSELASSKEAGKDRITHAIFGLLLALGSYAILNTINPQLLEIGLGNLPKAEVGAESSLNANPISIASLQQINGVNCPGTGGVSKLSEISQSFKGHVTYDQSKRHTYNSSTIFLDCSSFISQIYSCAGLPNPGNTSSDMLGSDIVTISTNGAGLNVGDIIGWKPGELGSKYQGYGHVVLYLGNASFIELSSVGIRTAPLQTYLSDFKHLKRIQ